MKFINICTALYDYQSRSNEELSFKADDTLLIIDKDDPDWYKAQLVTKDFDGPIGLVPSNYIEKVRGYYTHIKRVCSTLSIFRINLLEQ
jgi:hypothetical protein